MMSDLFLEGLNLAMYGMGTVFVFLTMLVGTTSLMSLLLKEAPVAPSSVTPAAPTTDPHLLAAVAAAVSEFRRRR
jgi:oxaloacetate decarboxylase gamma subunit